MIVDAARLAEMRQSAGAAKEEGAEGAEMPPEEVRAEPKAKGQRRAPRADGALDAGCLPATSNEGAGTEAANVAAGEVDLHMRSTEVEGRTCRWEQHSREKMHTATVRGSDGMVGTCSAPPPCMHP